MATIVERALSGPHRAAINAHRGVRVTFSRKSDGASLVITVNPAQTTEERETDSSVHRYEKLQDFIIAADVLGNTEPERGDSIYWNGRRYLATHAASGQVFDYHDSYRRSYRFHTIEVPYQCGDVVPPPEPPPVDPPTEPPVEPPVEPPPTEISAYGIDDDFYGTPSTDAYGPPPQ